MARLKHSEINYLGAPSKPTDFAHARGDQGELNYRLVRGAAADTDITVDGIKTTDELIEVLQYDRGAPAVAGDDEPTDRLGTSSITAADTIQCTVATGTSNTLIVIFRSDD